MLLESILKREKTIEQQLNLTHSKQIAQEVAKFSRPSTTKTYILLNHKQ